jgi:hypothetical protein
MKPPRDFGLDRFKYWQSVRSRYAVDLAKAIVNHVDEVMSPNQVHLATFMIKYKFKRVFSDNEGI